MHQASRPTQFGIGASLRRHEDPALISGKGRFVADLVPEGALHAFVLRSAVAHGRFTLHGLAAARAALQAGQAEIEGRIVAVMVYLFTCIFSRW